MNIAIQHVSPWGFRHPLGPLLYMYIYKDSYSESDTKYIISPYTGPDEHRNPARVPLGLQAPALSRAAQHDRDLPAMRVALGLRPAIHVAPRLPGTLRRPSQARAGQRKTSQKNRVSCHSVLVNTESTSSTDTHRTQGNPLRRPSQARAGERNNESALFFYQGPLREKNLSIPAAAGFFSLDASSGLQAAASALAPALFLGSALCCCGVSCMT